MTERFDPVNLAAEDEFFDLRSSRINATADHCRGLLNPLTD